MNHHDFPGSHNIQRATLANGITVLSFENGAVPSFELEGYLPAGLLGESPRGSGLAHFTAAALTRGTANRSFEQIHEELEGVGANLSFSSARHTTSFSGSGLDEDFSLVMDLLADTLRQPTFPVAEVEKVRGEILTSLQIQENNTRSQASKAFRHLLYGDHPYGADIQGTPASIKALGADDLAAFHRASYGPRGLVLTVVGAIPAARVLAEAERVLGDWRRPEQRELAPVEDVARPDALRRTHVAMAEKSQSDIVLGLPGPRRSVADYQDLRLANTILGVFGMSGRLGKSVREEQGLAYYAYSRLQGGLGPAPWFCGTGVAPDNVERAIASIRDEIRRMRDEAVPADELADSQAFLTGSLPVSLETNSGLAGIITDMELYGLGLDYLQTYTDEVNAVTPERVLAATRKYWSADEIAVAVAGP